MTSTETIWTPAIRLLSQQSCFEQISTNFEPLRRQQRQQQQQKQFKKLEARCSRLIKHLYQSSKNVLKLTLQMA